MNVPKYIIVHHEAPPVVVEGKRFKKVDDYHKERFNMKSSLGFYCGYHYFIEKDGEVIQAREEHEEGAHAKDYNLSSIGICLAGNFDLEMPTWEQRTALKGLLGPLSQKYSILFENIIPHRKVANKSCYGKNLPNSYARDLAPDYYTEKIGFLRQMVIHIQDLLARRKVGKIGADDPYCL